MVLDQEGSKKKKEKKTREIKLLSWKRERKKKQFIKWSCLKNCLLIRLCVKRADKAGIRFLRRFYFLFFFKERRLARMSQLNNHFLN